MKAESIVFALAGSLFGLLAGWIASRWGVGTAFAAGGIVTLAIGVWSWFWVMRVRAANQLLRQAPAAVVAGGAGESPIGVARRR